MDKYDTDLKNVIYTTKLNPMIMKLIFYQMLRAVNYIHALNICHRDIKPDNFFLKGYRVVLGDFGAAKKIKLS